MEKERVRERESEREREMIVKWRDIEFKHVV